MAQDANDTVASSSKYRTLRGRKAKFLSGLPLVAIPVIGALYVMHVPEYLGLPVYKEQYLSVILTLLLVATWLNFPLTRHSPMDRLPWYDGMLILLSLLVGGYVAVFYPEIVPTLGYIVSARVLLGGVMIFLVLEAGRRVVGWPIVIIGIVFVIYAPYAYVLPGVLNARMIPWSRVITSLYLSPGALLGIPLAVACTIVFSFIFFGRILFSTGGGQFLSNIALAVMGKYRGGPAKVAILASSLFGSLSGSASANVAMTGIVTIPLMKKTGYRPHIAAAIEAVASTGGLIMPPIMAATAFIMAEFLEMPYPKIALAATVPAILYYLAVFTQVHLEAVKHGMKGLSRSEVPSLKNVVLKGWHYFIPAAVLIYCLFVLFMQPSNAALYGVAATFVMSLFRKSTRGVVVRDAWKMLENTGRGVVEVGIICAIAGLVIGAISLTGLGLSLSDALVGLSGGNVFVLLILSAIGAIVLGMGMPVTATYIMLVVLIAPALIELGVDPLAAHLFIMYFGVMSFLTPPVAIAAYVAAGIAGSNPMLTGISGVKLGIVAYVVPFVFVFSPSLLLKGPVGWILVHVSTAIVGTLALAVACEGYLFAKIGYVKRSLLLFSAIGLISHSVTASVIGGTVILVLFLVEYKTNRQTAAIVG